MYVLPVDRPAGTVSTSSAAAGEVAAETVAPLAGLPGQAQARLIRAGLPAGPTLAPSRSTPKTQPRPTPRPDSAPPDDAEPFVQGSHTTDIIQDPSLLHSPALLFDFQSWNRDRAAATARGSASQAYLQLALMLYDRKIERPWEAPAYARTMNERLTEFRRHFASDGQHLCDLPLQVTNEAEHRQLATALRDPRLLEELRTRQGLNVYPAIYLNHPRAFDLMVNRTESSERETLSLWRMQPRDVQWRFTTPVLGSVDSYKEGFFDRTSPSQFAIAGNEVIIDDADLRDRAMAFAHQWKFQIRVAQNGRRENPVYDSESLQFRLLAQEHRAELDATYERLLVQVASNPATTARFQRERAAGDYPVEVYQHVAYAHLRGLERLQSGYYAAVRDQRTDIDAGHMLLESLLTMQRYSPSWRFMLMEVTTQSNAFTAHSAVLDQMVNSGNARGFAAEQIKAILGVGPYAGTNLYDRLSYAILADELFDAGYLREQQPEIFAELARSDGTIRSIRELPRADQIRILSTYLMSADGHVDRTAGNRLQAVFATRIREADYRELADVIHRTRLP
jgi:hypothetical protein